MLLFLATEGKNLMYDYFVYMELYRGIGRRVPT